MSNMVTINYSNTELLIFNYRVYESMTNHKNLMRNEFHHCYCTASAKVHVAMLRLLFNEVSII